METDDTRDDLKLPPATVIFSFKTRRFYIYGCKVACYDTSGNSKRRAIIKIEMEMRDTRNDLWLPPATVIFSFKTRRAEVNSPDIAASPTPASVAGAKPASLILGFDKAQQPLARKLNGVSDSTLRHRSWPSDLFCPGPASYSSLSVVSQLRSAPNNCLLSPKFFEANSSRILCGGSMEIPPARFLVLMTVIRAWTRDYFSLPFGVPARFGIASFQNCAKNWSVSKLQNSSAEMPICCSKTSAISSWNSAGTQLELGLCTRTELACTYCENG
uniref:Uncharacterized protein n=1 Tax=Branchiostoma floridae TaxID=7739 RepID=C3ZKH0_BRAFL|eukprot:XP_002591058.1 hypothetical protein BRAFLDRAFT_69387 [Branchiostoma floridae]